MDPKDKSLNHATIAADPAHSHKPHEKGRRERGKSDFQWLRPARQKALEQHCLGIKSYDTGAQEITQIVHCLGQHQNPSASMHTQTWRERWIGEGERVGEREAQEELRRLFLCAFTPFVEGHI